MRERVIFTVLAFAALITLLLIVNVILTQLGF